MSDTVLPFAQPDSESRSSDGSTLHGDLVANIRELIVEGDLEPGAKVPERILSERYGVSRTPLREALKTLASEGLLELLPHRGARVARLTAEDVDQMFPIMGALEALSGELACQNLTEEQFAEIQALHYQMVLHYTRRELKPYFQVNQEIHEKILAASANPLLLQMYQTLSGRIRRARYVANMSSERWSQAVKEHEEMLNALAARDGTALADVLKRHLSNKCETVKSHLESENAES
ncbi:MAG: GntR family transcriptional regulator [Rhodospirillaceae bacterium]|nr:GntR family transcriptional regulator [Rhodospirillaceae bacterium]|tara:strand:- start:157 stop:864 length:708 start_codon:yes stop_codon:yes gene_type:complete